MKALEVVLVACLGMGLFGPGAARAADDALGPLIAGLQDGDASVRANAAKALGETADPRAVVPLTALLVDEERRVRYAAACALREMRYPEAIGPLMSVVRNPDESPCFRRGCAMAVARIEDPRAVEWLLATLNDGAVDAWARSAAVYGLGYGILEGTVTHPMAIGALITAAEEDEDHQVRLSADRLLERIVERLAEQLAGKS